MIYTKNQMDILNSIFNYQKELLEAIYPMHGIQNLVGNNEVNYFERLNKVQNNLVNLNLDLLNQNIEIGNKLITNLINYNKNLQSLMTF